MNTQYITYGFAFLLVCAIIGFWPSYFSQLFDGTASFNQYFHFHAATAILWLFMIIAQPILIRNKKITLHRTVGKASYVLVPLLYISIILLAHNRTNPAPDMVAGELWIPFKDLIIFTFGYGSAIIYRKFLPVHYRGMMVAGFALIEPAMVRVMLNVLGIPYPEGYYAAILPIYLLLLFLIYRERNAQSGRWVFPVALGLFLFIHTVVLFNVDLPLWGTFAQWFISLPITT